MHKGKKILKLHSVQSSKISIPNILPGSVAKLNSKNDFEMGKKQKYALRLIYLYLFYSSFNCRQEVFCG